MSQAAYIGLNNDHVWTLYWGDGSEEEAYPLVTGQSFVPGEAIREAVAELEAWADANGYRISAPKYSTQEIALQDLIEPEIYDEVFGQYGDEP